MIQRIQTVYMALAVVLCILCMCLCVGHFDADGLVEAHLTNLSCRQQCGAADFVASPMFAVLALSAAIGIRAIFGWRNRHDQAKLCVLNIMLLIGWHVLYVVFAHILAPDANGDAFIPAWPAALPLLSIALYILARRAINKDEALVRAADRIR